MIFPRAMAFLVTLQMVAACTNEPLRTAPLKVVNPSIKVVSPTPTASAIVASPTVAPLSTPPRPESPTPMPSGYVSPLPLSAFPADPVVEYSAAPPVREAASADPFSAPPSNPTPAATQKPTPTPIPTPAVVNMRVVANNLITGPAAISGVTMLVIPGADMAPLGGTTVTIRPLTGTRRAELVTGTNGAYQLSGLAEGKYYVSVSKAGYASDPAPTTVTVGTGHLVNVSNFVLLKQ